MSTRHPDSPGVSSRPAAQSVITVTVLSLLALSLPPAAGPELRDVRNEVACGSDAGPILEMRADGSPLSVVVAPDRGGEMIGLALVDGAKRHELLFRGMDLCPAPGWEGKAPLLWPATGRNWLTPPDRVKGTAGVPGWRVDGQTFALKIHGFARDQRWRVIGGTTNARESVLRLALSDNPETRAVYPFGFHLEVRYSLRGSTVEARYTVRASKDNSGSMPFSIGNHITFKTAAVGTGGMTITAQARRHLLLDTAGRPTGVSERVQPLIGKPLQDFGIEKAYSLTGFAGSRPAIRLDDSSSGISITLSHRGSMLPSGDPVLFNLWGNSSVGFFAAEPWWGKQNSLNTGDGLVRLPPGKAFTWTIRISIAVRGGSARPEHFRASH